MSYARISSIGQPGELRPGEAITFERDGAIINASYQTVMLWSDG